MDSKLILILFPALVFLCMAVPKPMEKNDEKVNNFSNIERQRDELSVELKRMKRLIPSALQLITDCFPIHSPFKTEISLIYNTAIELLKTRENKIVKRNVPDLFELNNFDGNKNNVIEREKRFVPFIAVALILFTTSLSVSASVALSDEIEKRKENEEILKNLTTELKNDELNRKKIIEEEIIEILKNIKSEANNNNNTRLKRDLENNDDFISVEQFLSKVNTSSDAHLMTKRMIPLTPLFTFLTPHACRMLAGTVVGAIAISSILYIKDKIKEHFEVEGFAPVHRNMLNQSMENLERAIAIIDLSDENKRIQINTREKRHFSPIFSVESILGMYFQNKRILSNEVVKGLRGVIKNESDYQQHRHAKRSAGLVLPAANAILKWFAITATTTVLSSAIFTGWNYAANLYEDDARAQRYDDMVDRIQKRLNETCLLYNHGKFVLLFTF